MNNENILIRLGYYQRERDVQWTSLKWVNGKI